MRQVRNARRRNQFWKQLGYPNLVRARAARAEAIRRRRLLGLGGFDHSLDHVLEYAAPLIPRRGSATPRDGATLDPKEATAQGQPDLSRLTIMSRQRGL